MILSKLRFKEKLKRAKKYDFSMRPILIDGKFQNGEIVCKMNDKELHDEVMKNFVVVLKNVFTESELLNFRKLVVEWANSINPIAHGTPLQNISTEINFHRIDNEPSKSATPHLLHTFGINNISLLKEPFKTKAKLYIEALCNFQNRITGNKAELSPTNNPLKIRPQIIHYLAGGGYFEWHKHNLEPQRIGMIVGLSKKGIDHKKGSTRFKINGEILDTDEFHDIGDIILFRYDLPHDVPPIDPYERLDWSSEKGRWTFVFPYY